MSVKIYVNSSAKDIDDIILNQDWKYVKLHENIYQISVDIPQEGYVTENYILKTYPYKHLAETEATNLHILQDVEEVPKVIAVGLSHDFNYILMTKAKGEELFNTIIRKGRFTHRNARDTILHLLHVVEKMHAKNMCHLDIKPENIIYDEKTNGITLIDFEKDKRTDFYLSPEYFDGEVRGKSADMWCVGTVLYILLRGGRPFEGESSIRYSQPFFPRNWCVSLKHFLLCCFEKDPKKRITVKEALEHPWITGKPSNSENDHRSEVSAS